MSKEEYTKKSHEHILREQVDTLMHEVSSIQNILTVPKKSDFGDYKGMLNIECATLFADFGGVTNLVDNYDKTFASWVLKSYLTCVSSIVHRMEGVITAFEGDGLMGIFMGDDKESQAVKCAFQIQWAVSNIIQPKIDSFFPELKYKMSQVVGIDSSEVSALKTDVWEHYDLLWVGRSANYAANLTKIYNPVFSTYVTSTVHKKLSYIMKDSNVIWDLMEETVNGVEIFRSSEVMPLE